MKKLTTIIVFLFTFHHLFSFHVVGYFPTWSGNVNTIQYNKLTHIIYAFILPTSSGGISSLSTGNSNKLITLCSLAHAQNVKVLIAVGGWDIGAGGGNDGAFETLAASASARTTFTVNLINFVNTYNLDGVDMDWEYPDAGASANNFALLMSELSDSLHNRGKLLTAAVVNGAPAGDAILDEVFDYVDFLNIMAYDAGTPHSSYTIAYGSLYYWVDIRGLPASKAVLGVPFYGRDPYTSYSTLVSQDAQAPYKNQIGSVYYNGIQLMKDKTALAKTKAGGIMIWELSMDTFDNTSLLKAIHDVKILGVKDNSTNKDQLLIYPNPASESIYINYIANTPSDIQITIMDLLGEEIYNQNLPQSQGVLEEEIKVEHLPAGVYVVRVKAGETVIVKKFVKN